MTRDLDEVKRQVREGKLVPIGSDQDAFITRAEHTTRPKPGDIVLGGFIVMSVDPTPHIGGWDVKVRRLVPPRANQRG
jgi:hypothetical protein